MPECPKCGKEKKEWSPERKLRNLESARKKIESLLSEIPDTKENENITDGLLEALQFVNHRIDAYISMGPTDKEVNTWVKTNYGPDVKWDDLGTQVQYQFYRSWNLKHGLKEDYNL